MWCLVMLILHAERRAISGKYPQNTALSSQVEKLHAKQNAITSEYLVWEADEGL